MWQVRPNTVEQQISILRPPELSGNNNDIFFLKNERRQDSGEANTQGEI